MKKQQQRRAWDGQQNCSGYDDISFNGCAFALKTKKYFTIKRPRAVSIPNTAQKCSSSPSEVSRDAGALKLFDCFRNNFRTYLEGEKRFILDEGPLPCRRGEGVIRLNRNLL